MNNTESPDWKSAIKIEPDSIMETGACTAVTNDGNMRLLAPGGF